jgi:hypothetical protein
MDIPRIMDSMEAHKKFHIGEALYKRAVHHESFEQLWETKWKAPVRS